MKFSYSLLKKLVPGIKSPAELVKTLEMSLFEVESIEGDTLDIKVLANRYSDAASHWGIARVVSAALGKKMNMPMLQPFGSPKRKSDAFGITIEKKEYSPRYSARYVEIPRINDSPAWMQEILKTCGIRPINVVVDIMNYVMIEVGQPMHAFDFERIEGGKLIVRKATNGESILTLDNSKFDLDGDLVIADEKGPLAIAGIKGGKRAEVDSSTRWLLLEAANFDQVSIYKTSKKLGLKTDASTRFANGLSPALVERGMGRASELLKEICGATLKDWVDIENEKPKKITLRFDVRKFNSLTGLKLPESVCVAYLKRLGFLVNGTLVSPPIERLDIQMFEDLVDEIMSLHGYDKVPVTPPEIQLTTPFEEPLLQIKEKLKKIVVNLGPTEVYTHSFESEGVVEIENPIAEDKRFLRMSLLQPLLKVANANLRFTGEVKIFEVGKVFPEPGMETLELGILFASKHTPTWPELRGTTEALLEKLGAKKELRFSSQGSELKIRDLHGNEVGKMGNFGREKNHGAYLLIDVEKLAHLLPAYKQFKPLPRYPAAERDISIVVAQTVKTGDILETITEISGGLLPEGAEVVDFYESQSIGSENQGLTIRLKFRREDRTLTDKEVNEEMEKVSSILKEKFSALIR